MNFFLSLSLVFLSLVAQAQTKAEVRTEMLSQESREAHKMGFMIGIGSPYPSLLGLSLGYHLNKDLRVSLGWGEVEVTTSVGSGASSQSSSIKASTYDLGADYFFMEDRLRPLLGLHVASFNVSGDGEIELQGFKKSGVHAYTTLGIDWVADSGYQVGTGFNVAFAGATGTSFFVNTGYFW